MTQDRSSSRATTPASPAAVSDTVAARYRPRRLSDLVGQRHVVEVLRHALAAGKLPRQILFSGGSGLGKTTLARCVAAALCCENPSGGESCGVCASCGDVAASTHPDVVEFDAASHGTKEQIRELASRALTAPARAGVRVYVVDEVHALSGGSQGAGTALLRLLEEPPSHVVFLLATTDPDKMLRTNRGRCVEFSLRSPSSAELAAHLVTVAGSEAAHLTLEAASEIVSASDPALGVRGALMNLERVLPLLSSGTDPQDAVSVALGTAPTALRRELLSHLASGDTAAALASAAEVRSRVGDAGLRDLLIGVMRNSLRTAASNPDRLRLAADRLAWCLESRPTPAGTDLLCTRIALSVPVSPSGGDTGATRAEVRPEADSTGPGRAQAAQPHTTGPGAHQEDHKEELLAPPPPAPEPLRDEHSTPEEDLPGNLVTDEETPAPAATPAPADTFAATSSDTASSKDPAPTPGLSGAVDDRAPVLERLRAKDRLAAAVLAATEFELSGSEILMHPSPAASRMLTFSGSVATHLGLTLRVLVRNEEVQDPHPAPAAPGPSAPPDPEPW